MHLPFFDTVQAGGSFKTFRIDYTARSPYGNDTPYSPVPGIDPFFLDTSFRSYQTGAYLQASKQVASRVNVTLGGRFDHYDILSQARFSPRAGVKVRLTDTLSWNSSVGSYYQQPAFLFVSAFPQNASLVPWRADHFVTGLDWSPAADLRVTAEAYRKTYTDYPVASGLPSVSLANIGDTFDVREILFPLTSAGEGHSEGVEFFVEKRLTSKLYGQGNLSLSRTRHAGLDGVLRPGSFDYPFVFNLLGGYRLSPVWEFSARLSFLSGRPFTPYDQAVSTAQRRGVYDLTRVNAERAPDYARVDVRVDRTFSVGGQPLNLFVGVQNVTNRRNFASYTWNRRTNAQQFGEQQGIFPIAGFRLAVLDVMSPGPLATPTVLVTGATGYIGGRLVPVLEKAGVRARVVLRHVAVADQGRDRPDDGRRRNASRAARPQRAGSWRCPRLLAGRSLRAGTTAQARGGNESTGARMARVRGRAGCRRRRRPPDRRVRTGRITWPALLVRAVTRAWVDIRGLAARDRPACPAPTIEPRGLMPHDSNIVCSVVNIGPVTG